MMFDELHYWLMLGSTIDDVKDVIDDKAFSLSTDLVIAVPSNITGYELHDAYNPWKARGAVLNLTFLGSWQQDGQLKVVLKENKFTRRANMHGLPLKASCFFVSTV